MIKFSKRKVVIVALVACLLIGTTVFAAGQITSYRSWSRANDEIEDYATACEKAVELDIQTKIPEQLSNGYVFESANIGGMEGLDEEGNILIGDEMLTPDSSRFWPVEGYEPGKSQPSYDKQFVRDWLLANPDSNYLLPDEIIDKTIEKYKEAYKLLTGKDL